MKKTINITKMHHQLCFAHGIHLAVTKVLYNRNEEQVVDEVCERSDGQEETVETA